MTITEHTTVGEIAATIPSSVRVFQRHNVDFCCGGKRELGAVCREQGLSLPATVAEIETSASPDADDRDWTREPLSALADHIVERYHTSLREELPRLQALATKVARVHGAKSAAVHRINQIVEMLSADLRQHMDKEEAVLFPAIRALDTGAAGAPWIAAPVAVLEHEHDRAGGWLEELRHLTAGYTVPEWGCATVRALYQGLAELESTMHLHVHLENNVLFARTLRLIQS